jgi:hypothetical protein
MILPLIFFAVMAKNNTFLETIGDAPHAPNMGRMLGKMACPEYTFT